MQRLDCKYNNMLEHLFQYMEIHIVFIMKK